MPQYRNLLAGVLIYLLMTYLFSLGSLSYYYLFVLKAGLKLSVFMVYLGNAFVAILCFFTGWFLLRKKYTENIFLIVLMISIVLIFGANTALGYSVAKELLYARNISVLEHKIIVELSRSIVSSILTASFVIYLTIAMFLKKDSADHRKEIPAK